MPNKITPVVIAVIKRGKRFLLTKRVHVDPEDKEFYHGAWQLPGGGVEFDESPEMALQREILEEVGVKIHILGLVPKIYTEVRNNWQGLFIVYLCKVRTASKITLNEEASEYSWFNIKEIKKLKYLPFTIEMIKDSLKISVGKRT
ncbi:NUDIX hydrolase [Candidatus Roizmanbacteria bacterium]|nr:NUDIX hydrolase [Candidatus Roizmanbacteria bacterium]